MDRFKEGFNYWVENNSAVIAGKNTADWIDVIKTEINEVEDALNSFKGWDKSTKSLKGDVAEYYHSGTFNIDATVKRSSSRTYVDRSNELGSVDISSNYGKSYGLKYYADGEKSAKEQAKSIYERYKKYISGKAQPMSLEEYMEKNGLAEKKATDPLYEGQDRIIPSDQIDEADKWLLDKIENERGKRPDQVKRYKETKAHLKTRIEDGKGVESTELTKKDAETLAADAKKGEVKAEIYGFDMESVVKSKYIVKEAIKSGLYASVFSMIVKTLPDIFKCIDHIVKREKVDKEELKTMGLDALSAGGEGFVSGSIVGALITYCKMGVLGDGMKAASPQLIGTMSALVFDTIKNAFKLGKGIIDKYEFEELFSFEAFASVNSLSIGFIGQTIIPFLGVGYLLGSLMGMVMVTTVFSAGVSLKNAYEYNALYFQWYYSELLKIDLGEYQRSAEVYRIAAERIEAANSEDRLHSVLVELYDDLKLESAWSGEFDSFMENKDNKLIFR